MYTCCPERSIMNLEAEHEYVAFVNLKLSNTERPLPAMIVALYTFMILYFLFRNT